MQFARAAVLARGDLVRGCALTVSSPALAHLRAPKGPAPSFVASVRDSKSPSAYVSDAAEAMLASAGDSGSGGSEIRTALACQRVITRGVNRLRRVALARQRLRQHDRPRTRKARRSPYPRASRRRRPRARRLAESRPARRPATFATLMRILLPSPPAARSVSNAASTSLIAPPASSRSTRTACSAASRSAAGIRVPTSRPRFEQVCERLRLGIVLARCAARRWTRPPLSHHPVAPVLFPAPASAVPEAAPSPQQPQQQRSSRSRSSMP